MTERATPERRQTVCRIDVVVFEGCPNAEGALELVRATAARLAPRSRIDRIDVGSGEAADRRRFYGSPTILVDSEDIEGRTGPSTETSCRVYEGGAGLPPEWMVEAAILRALGPRHILFLCVANSARSQMAEGLARAMAPEELLVSSAGSNPGGVRPEAIAVLSELGIDISSHRSKSVAALDTSTVDAVITLCAEEVCPVYLGGARKLHWGLPDPAAVENEAARLESFRATRDELKRRLELLLRRKEDV